MSIKKLFESTNKVDKFISDTTSKDAFNSEAESQFNIEQKTIDQERYVPQVDYSYPENFARYGSARLYYKSALTRISEFYPYDGSEGETNEFLNGCLDIERYILDNLYPRTNGYIILNNAGHTTKVMQNGFGFPNSNEHIDLKGGPGVGRVTSGKLRDLLPNPKNSSYDYSNIYDENIYQTAGLPSDYGQGSRTSNLRSNFNDGVTLEFWLKTGSIDPLTTQRQVVFDLWNNEHSSSDNYGRLTLEVTGANHAQPSTFRLSIASGSTVINSLPLGDFAVSQLGDWAHYAVVLSAQSASLYVNGQRNNVTNYGTATATIAISDSGGIINGETFTLVDSTGVSTVYTINGGVNPDDGGGSGGTATVGFSGVGGGGAGKIAAAAAMVTAINATTDANYTAVSDGVDTVTITQGTVGASGNRTNTDSITSTTVSDFTGGKTLGALYEPNTIGRIGALVTNSIPASSGAERTGSAGSGRLSGSMDEFRFWKTARNGKQIGENWFTQVRGGANSDISNTTLGVYYKFNEGITGVNTTDNVVLDYAGRVTNGTWTGYNAGARNTGSAIVSASAATAEFLDPIIRTNHPSYVSLNTELLSTGSYHDGRNTNKLLNLLPSWILQENDEDENFDLNYITHIMGTYFDKLYLQISDLPNLRHQTHTSGTFKPISFAEHLPQSLGLYSPEIFIDSTVLERFMNRSADGVFENELEEAKNLIYQNLYNNLAEIYKAKGTEQSVRNVLKCFNINENILSLKVNSNNSEFILRNNLEQKLLRKNCANFNTIDNSTAVIYSKKLDSAIFKGSSSEILGSITGSTRQYGYGFTYEGNVIFPNFEPSVLSSVTLRDSGEVSLFGTVTPLDTTAGINGTDTTAINATLDFGNFKFFAVRDDLKSTNAYFKLVVANPTGPDIILTSSVYNDVYNDEPWNLSVRVRPKNYPLSSFVDSTTHEGYDVIFTGFNPKTTDLFNSFILSASVDETLGKKYIESRKRAYVGANRENVTGPVINKSDVLVSSVAYWLKSLDNTDLQQHSVDLENIGLSGSFRSLSALDTTDSSVEVLGRDTLAFNWNFRNVDSSDSSGNFVVEDFSSGSTDVINKFGWAGGISGYYYTGYGFGFANSSTSVVNRQSVNTYKFIDPERPISSDMVQIFSDSDDLTPNLRKEEIIPNYVYALEKSVYGAISEEMLDFFAGVVDFRSIIGAPVNYYRHRYKEMEKLRQTFFQRVSEVSTVEKYTEYYKWFDDALTTIISQLIPASGEYINDIQNVIESHVLERNKYQNRLNIIDSNTLPEFESATDSGDPGGDLYVEASSPLESSPRPTNRHPVFWQKRADRRSLEIRTGTSSAQVAIDTQRNKFRDVIYSNPVPSSSFKKPLLVTSGGTKYRLNNFNKRTRLQKFKFDINVDDGFSGRQRDKGVSPRVVKAGTNFEEIKSFDYFRSAVTPGGPINSEGGKLVPVNVLLGLVQDSVDLPYVIDPHRPADAIVKRKKVFKVQHGRDYEDGIGFKNVKSSLGFPFNVISSSVEVNSGYNAEVVSRVGNYLMITNVHNDVYGDNFEVPMQGAFTRDVVGGLQYRHIRINTGSDQQDTRPEGFRIHLGTCPPSTEGAIGIVGPDYPPPNYNLPAGSSIRPYPYPHTPKAHMYRDLVTKRPVNIRNIVNNDGNVTVPGNFKENYQVIHSVGSFNNPRAFIDKQPTLPSQLSDVKFTTNVRTLLGIKRTNDAHTALVDEYSTSYLTGTTNKSIIISRFSAPGGIEVMSKGYLDFKSSELSPYNSIPYRNLTVVRPSQGPSGTISTAATNGDTTDIQVFDIHGRDYGLRSHLSRHANRFGRDSLFVTNPGDTYTELPSFHKINRNNLQRIQIAGYNNQFVDFYGTSSVKNNYFVQHQIPRSDRQYMWLSNSVQDVSDIKYSGFQKIFNEQLMPYRTSSSGLEFYWTFVQIADSRINGLSQSTNGLNILINDPITESENTLGHTSDTDVSNYMNAGFFANPAARKAASTNYLNQLLTSRGATYGWGWNKLRFNNNKILRNERTKNELTIATGSDQHLRTFRLAPVSLKGRESFINFDATIAANGTATTENITLKFSNTNERIFFNELSLNNQAEINYSEISTPYKDAIAAANSSLATLNWFLYKQNIFPSSRNEFNTFVTKRVGYDNKYWRDSRTARVVLGNTLSSSLAGASVSKSSWPLDAPQNFLTRTSIFGFSGSVFQPGFAGSPQYYIQQPFRPLSGSASYNKTVPAAGELQNTYFSYFTINLDGGMYTTMELAPLYNRKHTLGAPTSVVSPAGMKIPETGSFSASFDLSKQIDTFAGEALWEAADQAGIVVTTTSSSTEKILKRGKTSQFIASASNPWYNDYDDFKSDLKLMAKGYSIIPEYRMSEHVKDYFNFGINNKSKTNFFEIVGTNSSSVNNNFYKDYSNSDFLENFMGIKKESLLNAKEIKLTCNAAIKYNAYDGFYPAQRTVDLSAQFIDSFKNSIGGGQNAGTQGLVTFNNQGLQQERGNPKNLAVPNLALQRVAGLLKPALDPMFSPGILYNSIKAGLAVDYPMITNHRKRLRRPYGTIHTASTDNFAMTITGSSTVENFVSGSGQYIGGQFWDKRIPFEAIIEPTKYILNTNFCELESHPSMSVDCNQSRVHQGKDYNSCYEFEAVTASYDDNADGIYTLMARNFFGACGEFFLDGGEISKLESNTVLDDLQFSIDESFSDLRPMYMARVKLRRSHNGARGYQFESDSFGNTGSAGYYGLKGAQRTINGTASSGQYPLPQDPMNNPAFQETFTMYSRPTAFGPPMAGRPTGSNANIMPFKSASKDSFSGYNPAFTPPYYDGEAWADLIFRPHVMNRETSKGGNVTSTPEVYDLNRILNETEVVCWRFDPGEEIKSGSSTLTASMPALIPVERTQLNNFLGQTPNNDRTVPSVYDGKRININSMQLTSSVHVFGTEKVLEQELDKFGNVISNKNKSVGTKWIIQPKWETPMLNFNDKGVHPIAAVSGTLTLPTYGSASVPRGMWHQFGVIPEDPNTGVFLEIGDIPEDWLRNHYEVLTGDRVTPYNGGSIPRNGGQSSEVENTNRHNLYKNVRSLSTLCGFDKTNSRSRLGEIKQSIAVHEAVVAIPYVIEEIDESENNNLPADSMLRTERKKFISIPKKRFAAAREEAAGSAAGDSLTVAGESIRKLRNALEKFVFPPELDFLNNKEVDPFAMYVFEFKYEFDRDDLSYIWQNMAPRDFEKVEFQNVSVAHNLANNELINEDVLANENLRWMVFKVKQRAQTDYFDLIADQANESTSKINEKTNKIKDYKFGFNWPYDYLSFVELVKLDTEILFKK
jgi:hypothetical protein